MFAARFFRLASQYRVPAFLQRPGNVLLATSVLSTCGFSVYLANQPAHPQTLPSKPHSSSKAGAQDAAIVVKNKRLLIQLLDEICQELGLRYEATSGDWVVKIINPDTDDVRYIIGYVFDLNTAAITQICHDKAALSGELERSGVPTISHRLFLNPKLEGYVPDSGSFNKLHNYAKELGYNVVVKPLEGSGGRDVFHCITPREFEKALVTIFSRSRAVTVSPFEKILHEYRAVVLDGEILL